MRSHFYTESRKTKGAQKTDWQLPEVGDTRTQRLVAGNKYNLPVKRKFWRCIESLTMVNNTVSYILKLVKRVDFESSHHKKRKFTYVR